MSYEKQTWQTGEVITEQKLNHMEDGIAMGGVLIAREVQEGENTRLDKTYQQIADAGFAIDVHEEDGVNYPIILMAYGFNADENAYVVEFSNSTFNPIYTTESTNGYPVRQDSRD